MAGDAFSRLSPQAHRFVATAGIFLFLSVVILPFAGLSWLLVIVAATIVAPVGALIVVRHPGMSRFAIVREARRDTVALFRVALGFWFLVIALVWLQVDPAGLREAGEDMLMYLIFVGMLQLPLTTVVALLAMPLAAWRGWSSYRVFLLQLAIFSLFLYLWGCLGDGIFVLSFRDRIYDNSDPIGDFVPWFPSVADHLIGGATLATLRLAWLDVTVPVWTAAIWSHVSVWRYLTRQRNIRVIVSDPLFTLVSLAASCFGLAILLSLWPQHEVSWGFGKWGNELLANGGLAVTGICTGLAVGRTGWPRWVRFSLGLLLVVAAIFWCRTPGIGLGIFVLLSPAGAWLEYRSRSRAYS
jgi:hypothetical protein